MKVDVQKAMEAEAKKVTQGLVAIFGGEDVRTEAYGDGFQDAMELCNERIAALEQKVTALEKEKEAEFYRNQRLVRVNSNRKEENDDLYATLNFLREELGRAHEQRDEAQDNARMAVNELVRLRNDKQGLVRTEANGITLWALEDGDGSLALWARRGSGHDTLVGYFAVEDDTEDLPYWQCFIAGALPTDVHALLRFKLPEA